MWPKRARLPCGLHLTFFYGSFPYWYLGITHFDFWQHVFSPKQYLQCKMYDVNAILWAFYFSSWGQYRVANILSLWARVSGVLPLHKISATMKIMFADVHTFSTIAYITSPLMSVGKVKVQFVSDYWMVFVLWRKHNRQHDLMYYVSITLTLFQHPYLCLQETAFMMFFHYPKATAVKGERVLDETELMLNWYAGCYTIC